VSDAKVAPHNLGDRWLSVDEIAIYLGIKRDTVYKWIERRNLPAHKAGRLWKFRRDEVDAWVRSENASSESSKGRSGKFHRHGTGHLRGGK
jgi:excisionase family DNA binding protein